MYHVVIRTDPEDWMGLRVKDCPFERFEDALSLYKDYLIDRDALLDECFHRYWEEENLEEYKNEGVSLNVYGEVYLLSSDQDFEAISRGFSGNSECFEYNKWLNEYDGLEISGLCEHFSYDYQNDLFGLVGLYDFLGAKTICTYAFELDVLDYSDEDHYENLQKCFRSIEEAETVLLNEKINNDNSHMEKDR